jgi:hypothetical protein
MKVDRSLRGVRAAVFAVACVGVSAAGHVWMSGGSVPVWALLIAVLGTGCAAYAAAGRQRGIGPIAGLMLAGELVLHLLFTAAQHSAATGTGMPAMPGMPPMPAMIMPHPVPASAWLCGGANAAAGTGMSGTPMSMAWIPGHGPAGMIAVHAVAGLLCAWWLRRGEAATFRLLRALAFFAVVLPALLWPGSAPVPGTAEVLPVVDGPRTPARRRLLGYAVIRRGPPVPVFCM